MSTERSIPSLDSEDFRCEVAREVRQAIDESSELRALVRAAASVLKTDIAVVSIVERNAQVFVARHGLGAKSTPRGCAFCSHTILTPDPMEIPNALEDPRFRDNPLVTGEPHIRYYLGIPVYDEKGWAVGTLCVVDPEPRGPATDQQMDGLKRLAEAVERVIATQREAHRAMQTRKIDGLSRAVHSSGTIESTPSWDEVLHAACRRHEEEADWLNPQGLTEMSAPAPVVSVVDTLIGAFSNARDDDGLMSIGLSTESKRSCINILIDSTDGITPVLEERVRSSFDDLEFGFDLIHHLGSVIEARIWIDADSGFHRDVNTTKFKSVIGHRAGG